jgi:hypothetical protein
MVFTAALPQRQDPVANVTFAALEAAVDYLHVGAATALRVT